jgi:hypothetical protein
MERLTSSHSQSILARKSPSSFNEKPFNLRLSTDYPKRALVAHLDTGEIRIVEVSNSERASIHAQIGQHLCMDLPA